MARIVQKKFSLLKRTQNEAQHIWGIIVALTSNKSSYIECYSINLSKFGV